MTRVQRYKNPQRQPNQTGPQEPSLSSSHPPPCCAHRCVSKPIPFHQAALTGSLPAIPTGSILEKVGKNVPSLAQSHTVQASWEPRALGANRSGLVSVEPAPPTGGHVQGHPDQSLGCGRGPGGDAGSPHRCPSPRPPDCPEGAPWRGQQTSSPIGTPLQLHKIPGSRGPTYDCQSQSPRASNADPGKASGGAGALTGAPPHLPWTPLVAIVKQRSSRL